MDLKMGGGGSGAGGGGGRGGVGGGGCTCCMGWDDDDPQVYQLLTGRNYSCRFQFSNEGRLEPAWSHDY